MTYTLTVTGERTGKHTIQVALVSDRGEEIGIDRLRRFGSLSEIEVDPESLALTVDAEGEPWAIARLEPSPTPHDLGGAFGQWQLAEIIACDAVRRFGFGRVAQVA